MIPEGSINKIIEAGIQAPSGENAQPWRFKIEEGKILLFNDSDSDRSLYNHQQSGSFVAHGACIENMAIAAASLGYTADVRYFPDPSSADLVASIELKPSDKDGDGLEEFISRRATNRKSYDASLLKPDEKIELLNVLYDKNISAKIVLVEDREKMAVLAKAASLNERMLIDNPKIHDFFFSHVRWTKEENDKAPNGFYIDTLELKPPQVKAFKLLRNPFVARIFSIIGMSKMVGSDNEKVYNTASAMIAIVGQKKTALDLILSGRILERIWLTATKLGLSIQPMTGALFLAEALGDDHRDNFSLSQQKDLTAAKADIYKILEISPNEGYVVVLLRIGRGGAPSARAARFPLDHFLIHSNV